MLDAACGEGYGTALLATQASVVTLDDDEIFRPGGAIPNGFSTPVGATRGWHVSNDPGAFEGAFALKSDEIGDGETAETAVAGWQLSPTYPLTAGPHVLRWVYAKDSTISVGLDRAYVDALVTPAFTPAP